MPTTMTFDTYAQLIDNWINADLSSPTDEHSAPTPASTMSDTAALSESVNAFESWSRFQSRTLEAVRNSALESTEDDSIALYTSGGVISVVTAQIQNLAAIEIPKRIWTLKNASISTLGFDGHDFTILGLNDVSHLEAHQNEQLITLI